MSILRTPDNNILIPVSHLYTMLSDWRSIYIFSNLNPISASAQRDNVMSKQALFMLHYGRVMVQDQDVEVYGGLIIYWEQ